MRKTRHLNRGIILAGMLAVMTAAYTVYGNLRFNKEKPAIKETVTSYISDVALLNITPEEYRSSDSKTCSEFTDYFSSELTKIADRYWSSDRAYHNYSGEYYNSKSHILNLIKESKSFYTMYNGNYVTDFTADISDMSVIRDTENTAFVKCKVNMSLRGIAQGNGYDDRISNLLYIMDPAGGRMWVYDAYFNGNEVSGNKEKSLIFTLKRTDSDEWKILYCSANYANNF